MKISVKNWPGWMRALYRWRIMIAAGLVILLIVAGVILLCRGCFSDPKRPDDVIGGVYSIDDYTQYVFNEDGKGALRLGGTDRLIYTYTVKGDLLTLNYEDEDRDPITYRYRFENGNLVITAQTDAGGTYVLVPQITE